MKRNVLIRVSIIFGLVWIRGAQAADFESVWNAILERSPALKSEVSQREAAEVQLSRAKAHWAPRLLLNAGIVSSNDPGTNLFSTLGSRSLQAADLNPARMNDPSREWLRKRGSAIVDWTLFEGGAKQAKLRGDSLSFESQALSVSAKKNEIYSEFVRDFAKLTSLRLERNRISELKEKLGRLVVRYKVGSKDNPVGYSGLLGMRSLLNRLESLLAQNNSETTSLLESLRIRSSLAQIDESTVPNRDPVEFTKEKLSVLNRDRERSNLRVESARLLSTAQSEYAKSERGKWLPRVGIFGAGNLVAGPKGAGTSTEYGAYLQWELFNASNLGIGREAALRSAAFEYRASESAENSNIERRALKATVPMLEENLRRVRDSAVITDEQVMVTEKLFRNGSVNAIQLAEVLSRRTDVIENQKQIESSLVSQITEDYLQNAGAL